MISRFLIRVLPLLVLVLISALSLILWRQGESEIAEHTGQHVDRDLARIERAIHIAINDKKAVIQASVGLIAAQPSVDNTAWQAFHQGLLQGEAITGLRRVTYYPRLRPENQGAASSLSDPAVLGSFHPALSVSLEDGPRPLPLEPDRAVDLAQDPDAAHDILRAITADSPALSQTQTLLSHAGRGGKGQGDLKPVLYALVLPVYRSGALTQRAEDRLQAMDGVVVAILDLAQLSAQAAAPIPPGVEVAIADLGSINGPLSSSGMTAPQCNYNPNIPLRAAPDEALFSSMAGEHRMTVPGSPTPLNVPGVSLIWSSLPNVGTGFLGNDEVLDTAVQCRHVRIALQVGDTAYHQVLSRSNNTVRSLGGLLIAFLLAAMIWQLTRRSDQAQASKESLSSALTASEQRYQQLFRGRKAVELIIDPRDGRIVDANDAAVAFYGWNHETLCEMTIGDINTLPADLVQAEMRKAALERRSHFYFRHRLANGQIRDVEVYSGVINGVCAQLAENDLTVPEAAAARADCKFLYSTIHDITDRKEAERALSESEAQFRVLFERSPLAIQIVDAQGKVVRVNAAWENLWQQSSAAVIRAGRSLFEDPQIGRSGMADGLHRAVAGDVVEIAPFAFHPNGSNEMLWLRAYAYPLERSDGAEAPPEDGGSLIEQVIIIYQDVTELLHQSTRLQRTLETLERSNEELEQFAYVASHDLQEPLRMVTSYLTLLRKRLGTDLRGDNREFLDFAVEGARRMQDLIRDLLDYARTGHLVEDADAIEATLALQQAQGELADTIAESGVVITAETLPLVTIDVGELSRLFTNLIGNAIKYRRPDVAPMITVRCQRDGAFYRFEVADNGIGIAEEYHEKIFKIFQRLHSAAQSSGTGIGLAICRKIVEHNGGEIGVSSVLGEGTTFWFTLPVPGQDGLPIRLASH
jgi:PAS domain S-box-containing protein